MVLTEDQRMIAEQLNLGIEAGSYQPCWVPKLNLIFSAVAVAASVGASFAVILAPDPTTISKWAAPATALALLASLGTLVVAYDALIDCQEQHLDNEQLREEVRELKQQQRQIKKTLEALQEAIAGH